ncbi:MAG: large subunit ribosomal protein [Deferribacteres bacterium]|jgi:large subunit ribosomal protein L24|nr:rplX [Deferribacteraceae bacterium]MDK2791973.1 large subunit ribosomal protein [Deferribacteres bacterium]
MLKYKLKKDDPIVVIAGKEKGKTSKVLKIDRAKSKIYAEGLNIVKRHVKPNQLNPEGGIIEKEMPIHVSNVMYLCKKCDKGVRLGYKVLESGEKKRFCRSCGEIIDKD